MALSKLSHFAERSSGRGRWSRWWPAILAFTVVVILFGGHQPAKRAYQSYTAPPHFQSEVDKGRMSFLADDHGLSDASSTSGQSLADAKAPFPTRESEPISFAITTSELTSPSSNIVAGLLQTPGSASAASESQQSFLPSAAANPDLPTGAPIPAEIPIDHSQPRSRLTPKLQDLLVWNPPTWATLHRPPYNAFPNLDYDPNRWEGFEKNKEFFLDNTLDQDRKSSPYKPYPDYNSFSWKLKFKGDYIPCEGLSGAAFNESDREIPKAYKRAKINADTEPDVGSFNAVGLDGSVCFDRYSRLGPFGQKGVVSLIQKVDLGALQNQCLDINQNRYADWRKPDVRPGVQFTHTIGSHSKSAQDFNAQSHNYHNRTAVLIRSWEGYDYEENDIVSIRSLVSELALQSGGEYHVFLLVMLKDAAALNDTSAYDQKLEAIPAELRSMTILWSENMFQELYPKVGQYAVNRAQFMPVQWFMETHPEFEFVWNHELDSRYIGHHYHFVEQIASFARKQPRKYLWERNARFYIPSVHGTFDDFLNDTNWQIAHSPYVTPVWGPQYRWKTAAAGPEAPVPIEQDRFEWGVGEEADFISLLPIWESRHTTWGWKRSVYNYPDSPDDIPIRAYINTHGRYSRRLLHAMHMENLEGRHMTSELWPSTVALHHGLKAVHAPHPIWFTHKWPGMYSDAVFNADGWGAGSFRNASEPPDDNPNQDPAHPSRGRGRAYDEMRARLTLPQVGTGPNGEGAMARWSQERDSVYNADREHNFLGWSWYYASDFGRMVYWRWLGWRQSYSIFTMGWTPEYDEFKDIGTAKWEEAHGRLCLPPMLLHPVKRVHEPELLPDGGFKDKGECLKSGC